ncbi:hypothetical protein [Bacteroides heparinolyticus]|uniref:hypothetical protein n=1 Tax=Prevotella heparinolytica TaxID=28113 RepID=UPI0035A06DCE
MVDNNGRTNVRQWLRQAYSPPTKYDAFFPTLRIGLNDLVLSGLFQQSAVSIQQSGQDSQQINESTTKQINISTLQQLTVSAGGIRAESPDYFSPILQGWGIDIRTLSGGLKA